MTGWIGPARAMMVGLLLAACSVLACEASDSDDDVTTPVPEPGVRKNVKHLTPTEKQDFVDAVLALKAAPPPKGIEQIVINGTDTITIDNYYDMFVAFHQAAVMETQMVRDGDGVAHANPAFPPWHRKLLLLYEQALRDVSGKDIRLPYWDWTDKASTDAMLSPDFMGPAGDPSCQPDCAWAVVEGPFRKGEWELTIATQMEKYKPMHPWTWIVRAIGQYEPEFYGYPVSLPTEPEIQTAMEIADYDVEPFNHTADPTRSFRSYLEGFGPVPSDPDAVQSQHMHNIGHDWISGAWKISDGTMRVGTMEPLDISPSDPVFFIHHCNVDRLWAEWQRTDPARMDAYTPDSGDYPSGWKRGDEMFPYKLFAGNPAVGVDMTPGDFLDFVALGYTYDTLP